MVRCIQEKRPPISARAETEGLCVGVVAVCVVAYAVKRKKKGPRSLHEAEAEGLVLCCARTINVLRVVC